MTNRSPNLGCHALQVRWLVDFYYYRAHDYVTAEEQAEFGEILRERHNEEKANPELAAQNNLQWLDSVSDKIAPVLRTSSSLVGLSRMNSGSSIPDLAPCVRVGEHSQEKQNVALDGIPRTREHILCDIVECQERLLVLKEELAQSAVHDEVKRSRDPSPSSSAGAQEGDKPGGSDAI